MCRESDSRATSEAVRSLEQYMDQNLTDHLNASEYEVDYTTCKILDTGTRVLCGHSHVVSPQHVNLKLES